MLALLRSLKPVRNGGHAFVLKNHFHAPQYRRGGKPCYECSARKKLILSTSEEEVRQAFIRFLLVEVGVPADCLEAEVPMSRFASGGRGRADIIVYGHNSAGDKVPVAIVECKEPNQPLIDRTLTQVTGYDAVAQAGLVIITNGADVAIHEKRNGHYQALATIPSYQHMLEREQRKLRLLPTQPIYPRPCHKPLRKKVVQAIIDDGFIGQETPASLHSFLVNLLGFLDDNQQRLARYKCKGFKYIEDKGIRFTSFGNASGGAWTGHYRYFLVNHKDEDHILSMNIVARGTSPVKTEAGIFSSETMLTVAVDNYDKSHMSLQLALDRFVEVQGGLYTIWHNGTLTNGKKGSVKRQEILDYITEHAPDMVDRHSRIILGQLSNEEPITWQQPATKKLVTNLIRYALLRDDFRRMKNQPLKAPRHIK